MSDALRGPGGTANLSLSRSSGRRIRLEAGAKGDVPGRSVLANGRRLQGNGVGNL
jgi:hypothetical protein